MPTYEYKCRFCHQISDAFQRMSDAPLTKCPHCGKEGLERIVSGGAGVIYKGEGWYVTDYSKKSSGGKDTSAMPTKGTAKAERAKEGSLESKTEISNPSGTKGSSSESKSASPDTSP